MKQSANIVLEMSKWFQELENLSNNFNSTLVVQPTRSNKYEDLYISMTKMMEDWSKILLKVLLRSKGSQLKEQANNIHRNFVCFYKYSSLENEVYQEAN